MPNLSWDAISVCLAQKIPTSEFERWLSPLKVECQAKCQTGAGRDEKGNIGKRKKEAAASFFNVSIKAENKYKMDWVKKHYGECISEIVTELCRSDSLVPKIHYCHSGKKVKQNEAINTNANAIMRAEDRFPGNFQGRGIKVSGTAANWTSCVSPYPTFQNFIDGKINRVAKRIAVSITSNETRVGSFFFFCGGSGLGKTHLLQATAKEFKKNKRSVVYVRSEIFVRSMFHHLTTKEMEKFKDIYRHADVLIIDDIHVFKGKPKVQEEFFHTLDARLSEEKIVILSADASPQKMDYFSDSLRGRLVSAPVAKLDKPDRDTFRAIIAKKCVESKLSLDEQCVNYIAGRATGSVREAEGALKLVSFYMNVYKKPADLPMMKKVFSNLGSVRKRAARPEEIRRAAERYYELSDGALKTAGREKTFVVARRMAMLLCREFTECSTTEIGKIFNRRHTAVLHAVRCLESEIKKNDSVKYAYEKMKSEIESLVNTSDY